MWDAVEAHRWYPPSSRRVTSANYELAVTPGSSGLTWIYGFHAKDSREAERLLDEIREKVASLGGTGARIQITPRAQPPELGDLLARWQFEPKEAAELLVCDLRDESGREILPSFRPTPGLAVREITTRQDYHAVDDLTSAIFELPAPRRRPEPASLKHTNGRCARRATRTDSWPAKGHMPSAAPE